MEDWKQAFWLSKYELKRSYLSILFLLLFLIGALFMFYDMSLSYFQQPFIAMDLIFIIVFGILTHRPIDIFKLKNTTSKTLDSHGLISLNRLPIKKAIIIKHYFLLHIMLAIPFHIILLTAFYIISPAIKSQISISSYLVFSIIWICLGLFISFATVASEAGLKSMKLVTILSIGLSIAFFSFIIVYFDMSMGGFVKWTIDIATHQPLLSTIIPLTIIIISWNFWMKKMLKNMKGFDYL